MKYRKLVCDYLEENKEEFEPFLDDVKMEDYLEEM